MINTLKTYQKEQAENVKNAENPQALVKLGDLFQVSVSSDKFAPRAKSGEQLIIATGVTAEEGDIVAIDRDEFEYPKLEFYTKGTRYFAVEVVRIMQSSRLKQIKEKRAQKPTNPHETPALFRSIPPTKQW